MWVQSKKAKSHMHVYNERAALLINDQSAPAETSVSPSFFEIITLFRTVLPYAVPLSPEAAIRTVSQQAEILRSNSV